MPAEPPDPIALPASWTHPSASGAGATYALCLYVSGATPLSARAIVNIRRLCEEHLADRYQLEIVDISQHPKRGVADQIIATPTLLRRTPLPMRRLIGDMSVTRRVIDGLELVVDARPSAVPPPASP